MTWMPRQMPSNRQSPLSRAREEVDFELVTLRIDAVRRGMDGPVAESAGLNVWPAAQEQTVDDLDDASGIGVGWEDDWHAAGRLDRADVRLIETVTPKRSVSQVVRLCRWRNADDRFHRSLAPSQNLPERLRDYREESRLSARWAVAHDTGSPFRFPSLALDSLWQT